MGTIPLLLKMKEDPNGLPRLSDRVGHFVRSNSEALFAIVSPKKSENFSKGVAITSILHTDEHSHIEPVRYGAGSGFFRTLLVPHSPGPTVLARLWGRVRPCFATPADGFERCSSAILQSTRRSFSTCGRSRGRSA
jgi:cholesterol oxidase